MEFSRLQIFFLLIMFIGISNHVILLPHLLQVAHRDAWVAALIGYLLLIVWAFILKIILNKLNHEKFSLWVKKRAGGFISFVILAMLTIYISLLALITFNDLINTVQIYFLPETSIWLIGIAFLIICIWSSIDDLKTIVYVAIILLPFVLILGDFVAVATLHEKDYSYALPIFMDGGGPVIKGVIIFLGASTDLILILLLQHKIQKQFSYLTMFILVTVLVILVVGPTLGVIASFGPEIASQMRFPAFEQWRLVTIGEHVSHLDFLAIFQLLSGTFIRFTLCIFLLWDMWYSPTKKSKLIIVGGFALVLIGITLPQNSDTWMQIFIQKYFYYASFIFGVCFTLIMLVIGKRKNVKEKGG